MYERPPLKPHGAPADTRGTGRLMDEGLQMQSGRCLLKARVFRAAVTAAMLAAVIQAFGAPIKW